MDERPLDQRSTENERVERRRFLRRGAITAAVAAAGGAVLAKPAGATVVTPGAADLDALAIGAANTNSAGSANATALTGSTNALTVPMLSVTQSGAGSAIAGTYTGTNSTASAGLLGTANTTGHAIKGTRLNGSGGSAVYAFAAAPGASGVIAQSSQGPNVWMLDESQVIPPSTGTWEVGSFVVTGGHVWYCYGAGAGTASKWTRLSSTFVPLATPVRVLNSATSGAPRARHATPAPPRYTD